MSESQTFSRRGFTLQGVPDAEYGRALIEWMAAGGMNRLEVRICGGDNGQVWAFEIRDFPELCLPDAAERAGRLRELIEFGRSCGVRVIPAFAHPDCNVGIVDIHPDYKAAGVVPHPAAGDLNAHALCFRHPQVVKLYTDAAAELVEQVDPDELLFWFSENYVRCECDRCRGDGEPDAFALAEAYCLRQGEVFYQAYEKARRVRGELDVSMWTTQGTRPHNGPLIRSLPRDVLWYYYDGERWGNYNLRRRAVIPEDIRRLRAEGFEIGAQLEWFSCGRFLTTPGVIRERVAEAADAGLVAVSGWIDTFPLNTDKSRGGAHPVLALAAELANRPGDDPDVEHRVMTQAALDAGLPEPVADAAGRAWRTLDEAGRTIYLADSYSYWWHGTNVPGAILSRIARQAAVDEIDLRWADAVIETTLPSLTAAVEALDQRIDALEQVADETGYLAAIAAQLRLAAAWGRFCHAVYRAGLVFTRIGGWDTWHGPWRDDRREMLDALTAADKALDDVEQWVEPGEELIGTSKSVRTRIPKSRRHVGQAIQAVEQGAAPSPLPDVDRWPYTPRKKRKKENE